MSINQVSLATKEFELLINTISPFVSPELLDSLTIVITKNLGGSEIYIPKRVKRTTDNQTIKDMHNRGIRTNEIARRMNLSHTSVKNIILS